MGEIDKFIFKKVNKELYLFIYYNNGKIKKYKLKDKDKRELFYLLTDIMILDII